MAFATAFCASISGMRGRCPRSERSDHRTGRTRRRALWHPYDQLWAFVTAGFEARLSALEVMD